MINKKRTATFNDVQHGLVRFGCVFRRRRLLNDDRVSEWVSERQPPGRQSDERTAWPGTARRVTTASTAVTVEVFKSYMTPDDDGDDDGDRYPAITASGRRQ